MPKRCPPTPSHAALPCLARAAPPDDAPPLAAPQADSEEGQDLCDALGVEVLPTLQFYRAGQKLWEHRGYAAAGQDLGEGAPGRRTDAVAGPRCCLLAAATLCTGCPRGPRRSAVLWGPMPARLPHAPPYSYPWARRRAVLWGHCR